MWIVKWILSAITLLLILLFAFFNQDQSASVQFFHWISPNLPLWVFLYTSFAAGLLLWFSISAMNVFKYKGRIYSLQREIKKIQEELKIAQEEHKDEVIENLQTRYILLNNLKMQLSKDLGERIIL